MIPALRLANLVLRVLLEIGALAAFAYWGIRTGDGLEAVLRAGGAIALATLFWGTFVAPRSLVAVPPPLKALLATDRVRGGGGRARAGGAASAGGGVRGRSLGQHDAHTTAR